ncbi:DUF4129 domain-containing protein [Pontibacter sp. SGAir0037]|uniref:DUF4129 domain-containing protein n=1 Tax=Pontibacter sp. SGAir0037 TaxID=2571030 RepID=UPI0010CD2EB9|nr:DUF4129 domain-containing protein [Pontibacter sp. SGAir0037]QCR22687.1 hypothetical protein C1N53_10255 [Pontibacter sp. SGAir0037]
MKAIISRPGFFALILMLHLLFGACGHAYAAVQAKEIPSDNSPIEVRYPAAEKLQAFRNDSDFQYKVLQPPPVSFWDKIKARINHFLRRLFGNEKMGPYWKYLGYAFALGITVFVVLKLLKVDFTGLFGKSGNPMQVPYEAYQENIHEMDFEGMLAEAIQQQDYRRAIRLYYLQSLKTLTDSTFIHWTPGKTNRSYLAEIENRQVQKEFGKVTNLFEYVWYGGSAITNQHFEHSRQTFADFHHLIRQHTS